MSDQTTIEVVLSSESTVGNPIVETVTVTGTVPIGPRGPAGADGGPGADGDSAYDVAVANGFVGTEAEWLDSLVGDTGATGAQGDPGVVQSIVAGTNVTVDATDPANPVVSAAGGGGSGTVESVGAGSGISVDSTDPANPVVTAEVTQAELDAEAAARAAADTALDTRVDALEAVDNATQGELDAEAAARVAADTALDGRLDTVEGYDTLGVTYPLSIDDTTTPGVANVKAWTLPHLEASIVGLSVASTAAEALLVTTGWTTTGSPQEVNVGDVIRTEMWGSWLNNDGTGRQTDLRLRIGGLAGTPAISFRIPTTVGASAVLRRWRAVITSVVVDSGGGALVLHSSGYLTLAAPANGVIDVYSATKEQTSVTIDFTADLEWVVTADHDTASANLDMTLTRVLFEHTQARP